MVKVELKIGTTIQMRWFQRGVFIIHMPPSSLGWEICKNLIALGQPPEGDDRRIEECWSINAEPF